MGETRTSVLVDESLAVGTHNFETGAAERDALVVIWTMTNATGAGDLGVTELRVVDPDGNVMPSALTPEVLSAAALTGSVASEVHRYDVRGISKLQVRVSNAAGASRDTKIFINHYWA